MKNLNKRILIISDLHIPYHHPDAIPFLKAVKKKINPTRVISIGDLLDLHALSFHPVDPDLPSPGMELRISRQCAQRLEKVFPKMDILIGNHEERLFKRAMKAHLPEMCIRSGSFLESFREILDVNKGWQWHFKMTEELPDGKKILFRHGLGTSSARLMSQKNAVCYVQGHYHSKTDVFYWSNFERVFWAMQLGCLVDEQSRAMAYGKNFKDRPMYNIGAIIDSQPRIIPFVEGEAGVWNGKVVF